MADDKGCDYGYGGPQGSGQIDFCTLVLSFASAAVINMGKSPDPVSGAYVTDLLVARQNIDILALLREKTRGNLNAEEERLLDQVLYEVRCAFVEAKKGNS